MSFYNVIRRCCSVSIGDCYLSSAPSPDHNNLGCVTKSTRLQNCAKLLWLRMRRPPPPPSTHPPPVPHPMKHKAKQTRHSVITLFLLFVNDQQNKYVSRQNDNKLGVN